MKKKTEENSLPRVEPERFQLCEDGLYWIDPNRIRHRITKAGICANGVRDLCVYWHGPIMTDVRVGKIAEVPPERILFIPKGDILWMNFEPPLADGKRGIFLDLGDPAIEDRKSVV